MHELIADASTAGYRAWNALTTPQNNANTEMPMLDALGNFTGLNQATSAVIGSGRDASNNNYMIDVYENGTTHRYPAATTVDGAILVLAYPKETWSIANGSSGIVVLNKEINVEGERVISRTDIANNGSVLRTENFKPTLDPADLTRTTGYQFQTNTGGISKVQTKTGSNFDEAATNQSGASQELQIVGGLVTRSITLSGANGQISIAKTYDDNSRLETTTTPDGKVVQKSFDTDNQLTGTITDTPDGLGGTNRAVTAVVNGKEVQITQHASAAALAIDKDNDGNFVDEGDFKSIDIDIGGRDALSSDLLQNALDNDYQSAQAILNGLINALERGDEFGALASGAAFVNSAYSADRKYYQNRSCLRPYLLGCSTKTQLKRTKINEIRACARARNAKKTKE